MRSSLSRLFFLAVILFCSHAYSSDAEEGIQAYRDKDYVTALEKLIPVATEGDAISQFIVGGIYLNGYGVDKNFEEAVKWITLSAKQGDAKAQFLLGILYQNGEENFQNDTTAVKWYKLAAEQGHTTANIFLASMYERGDGVQQNYARAYMFLLIALDLGNPKTLRKLSELKPKMTENQLNAARDMASSWLKKHKNK